MVDKEIEGLNQKSVYNEGYFQIMRLNDCWSKANYYSQTGKLIEWRWILDVVFRELARDVHKKQNGSTLNDFDANPIVKNISELDKKIKTSFLNKKKADIYNSLNKKDIYLRILQEEVGKGGKYVDDDAFSL